jgi:hypothetical protein
MALSFLKRVARGSSASRTRTWPQRRRDRGWVCCWPMPGVPAEREHPGFVTAYDHLKQPVRVTLADQRMVRLHECATPLLEVTQFRIPSRHAGTSGARKEVIRSRDEVGSCEPTGDEDDERGMGRLSLIITLHVALYVNIVTHVLYIYNRVYVCHQALERSAEFAIGPRSSGGSKPAAANCMGILCADSPRPRLRSLRPGGRAGP